MSENFDIEELLQTHLTDGEMTVPEDLFSKIDSVISAKEKRKRRGILLFWMGLFSIITLLLFAGFYLWSNQKQTDQQYRGPRGQHYLTEHSSTDEATSYGENTTQKTPSTDDLYAQNSTSPDLSSNDILSSNSTSKKGDNILLPDTTESHRLNRHAFDMPEANRLNQMDLDTISTQPLVNSQDEPLNTNTQDNPFNADRRIDSLQFTSSNTESNSTSIDHLVAQRAFESNGDSFDSIPKNDLSDPSNTDITEQALLLDTTESRRLTRRALNTAETVRLVGKGLDSTSNTLTTPIQEELDSTKLDSQRSDDLTELQERKTHANPNLFHEPQHITPPFLMPPPMDLSSTKFGLTFQGGPQFFSGSILKPYFQSGRLSNFYSPSGGVELGLGFFYQFGKGFIVELNGNWNQQKTSFQYDLLINEEDYFDLYSQGEAVPLENLDDPEACNCYLAEDVTLDYTLSQINVGLRLGYEFFQSTKFSVLPSITFGGSIQQQYTANNQAIVAFPEQLTEQFQQYQFGGSLYLGYRLIPQLSLGINPTFVQTKFTQKSTLKASSKQVILPLMLRWSF